MSKSTYGSDLTPKKLHIHGTVDATFSDTTIEINVFQALPTSEICYNILKMFGEVIGIEELNGPEIARLFDIWNSDPSLLSISRPGVEIHSNGTKYPSCTIKCKIPNPAYIAYKQAWTDAGTDYNSVQRPHIEQYFVGFVYRTGKWKKTISRNSLSQRYSNGQITGSSHPIADECLRRLREMFPEL